ncbi:YegP family protein [Halorussus gelatinilyticus]|uniref:YegP family protein n=1 Tax=Halorussus gelatinilyticus TaxID=2937524 RepID=A0A8U0IGH0_9EURY|nr:HVO_2922 family protein [Halorussus gelatinilyticus]UPV99148.1 YegP family protein [Halorussus gelatinilyticus]
MFDHEYTLVAHPRLRARLSYRSDDADLAAATVELDYRRDETWTEEGTAVEPPESPETDGVEWQGLSISLYRDGERVLVREFSSSSLMSDAFDALDTVERVAPSLVRKGRTAAKRSVRRWTGGRVGMRQLDGSTVEALEPPAKASFEVYEGKDGKWRWRLVHDNGNTIADSGQGYSSRRAAEKGLRSVKRNALGAAVERVGGDAERDVRSSSDAEGDPGTDAGSDAGTAES